ncbi:hypothetical protein CEE34_06480 [Candidatus Aerophobetes bacterium Ae_b3a]|nr:MAG: hypothetical protein CEE34_06480 [Candidatus Aerophobetes bacterium Ae_b3a]
MSQLKLNHVTDAETADSQWKGLYKVGGAAALIVAVLLPIEIIVMTAYPLPSTAIGYFTLFQSNRLIGLLDLYLLEIPVYALFVPLFLALYAALRRANESYMALATTLAIIGITVFLATNNPFSMLSLSDQYAAATTDAQRSLFLAAGQAMLANTNQRAVEGFNMGFLLVSVAGLIVSAVMLRSNIFSKVTAYVGILASALSLTDYFRVAFVPAAVLLLLFLALASCLLLLIWYILIARRLFQLGRLEKKTLPQQS